MSGWKDIATAPKDGTLIQLWIVPFDAEMTIPRPRTGETLKNVIFGRYARPEIGWWSDEKLKGYQSLYPRPEDCPVSFGWSGKWGASKYAPTHWKPLDEGPEGKGEEP